MTDGIDSEQTERPRPVAQEAHLEDHIEIVFPAGHDTVVLGDDIARELSEDIDRIIGGRDE